MNPKRATTKKGDNIHNLSLLYGVGHLQQLQLLGCEKVHILKAAREKDDNCKHQFNWFYLWKYDSCRYLFWCQLNNNILHFPLYWGFYFV